MSRLKTLVVRFIQILDAKSSTLRSIRIKSSHIDGDNGVEIEFINQANGAWPNLISIVHEVGYRSGDLISIDDNPFQEINNAALSELDRSLVNSVKVKIRLSNESVVHQSELVSEIRHHTIFGLPPTLYGNYNIKNLSLFIGANQRSVLIPVDYNFDTTVRSNDGRPYVITETANGKIEFYYLRKNNSLNRLQIATTSYLHDDVAKDLNRFKHTIKSGYAIYCFFPEEHFQDETPFKGWTEFVELMNNSAKSSLQKMLTNQVAAIERRIASISSRRRVYFRGEELGLVPENEQETVILYERYIAKNNYMLGRVSRLRLLDYSPQGIDSVCSFAANSSEPTTNIAVEFEFMLQNFFDHGHDPRQVRLILCYSMKEMVFPYDHFGITFDIDRTGDLPRLIDKSTGNSCYVFALDETLEER
jgi:hypothetical protein